MHKVQDQMVLTGPRVDPDEMIMQKKGASRGQGGCQGDLSGLGTSRGPRGSGGILRGSQLDKRGFRGSHVVEGNVLGVPRPKRSRGALGVPGGQRGRQGVPKGSMEFSGVNGDV